MFGLFIDLQLQHSSLIQEEERAVKVAVYNHQLVSLSQHHKVEAEETTKSTFL